MTTIMCTNKSCKYNMAGEICNKDRIVVENVSLTDGSGYTEDSWVCSTVKLNKGGE